MGLLLLFVAELVADADFGVALGLDLGADFCATVLVPDFAVALVDAARALAPVPVPVFPRPVPF